MSGAVIGNDYTLAPIGSMEDLINMLIVHSDVESAKDFLRSLIDILRTSGQSTAATGVRFIPVDHDFVSALTGALNFCKARIGQLEDPATKELAETMVKLLTRGIINAEWSIIVEDEKDRQIYVDDEMIDILSHHRQEPARDHDGRTQSSASATPNRAWPSFDSSDQLDPLPARWWADIKDPSTRWRAAEIFLLVYESTRGRFRRDGPRPIEETKLATWCQLRLQQWDFNRGVAACRTALYELKAGGWLEPLEGLAFDFVRVGQEADPDGIALHFLVPSFNSGSLPAEGFRWVPSW